MSASLTDIRGNTARLAANIFMRTLFVAFLNIIMYVSLMFIASYFSTKTVGSAIYQTDENGSVSIVTKTYYSDTTNAPETTQTETASSETGTETTETATTTTLPPNQTEAPIRTNYPLSVYYAVNILAQILMIVLLIAMPYSKMWTQGDHDSNSVNFGRMKEDKFRGLKIGLIAGIPSFIFYLILLVGKVGKLFPSYIAVYRILNISMFPTIFLFTDKYTADTTGMINQVLPATADISWALIFLLLLSVALLPFTCYLAYRLGYKHISVSDKIIYVNPEKRKKKRRY